MADIASLGIRVSTQGITQAKTELEGLSQSSRTAAAAAKEAGASWEKNTFSPTRLYAANKALADYRKGLQEAAAAAANVGAKGAQGLSQAAKSAKELQFATRNLPAQFTDIATALGSGQRPLQVLLQQGGQIKDMFGGVGPALRAMGSYVLGLINPFTVAAAAVAALGVAWKNAQDEAADFNKAIILTGNNAKLSADDLAKMAAQLDASTNATAGQAAEALAQVAGTGQFTAEQIGLVTKAALQMQDATGKAVEDTIKEFVSLKGDPVTAILKLNDAQHFLTEETLEQIKSLKEQGREADATAVAIRAYADTINDRTPEVLRNLSLTEAVWRDLKKAVLEFGDSVVGVFRQSDAEAKAFIQNHQAAIGLLGKLQSFPLLPFSGSGSFIAESSIKNATRPDFSNVVGSARGSQIVDSNIEREAIAFKDRYLSREESKKKAIAELDRLKSHYTAEEYKILKAGIEERFKPPKGPKGRSDGIEAASSRAAIKALEDQLKKEQGLLANQAQIVQANFSARNISAQQYYAEQKRLVQENQEAQERALKGEIAALQSRTLKGKDAINNAAELAEKEALLARVRADGAAKLEVLNIQEAAQLKQRQQANIAYADALDSGKEALRAEMASQVLRIQVGEREFEIRSRITQLYRDEAKELLNLARQRDAGDIDPETYKQRVEQLRSAIAGEVRIVRDGYDAMAEAQKDWSNGALKAFADYRDAANDVAGQTYGIFTNAMRGLEDVFVDFFTKGMADWRGFFDGIAAEITRFVVRQQLSKLVSRFLPGGNEKGDSAAAISGAAASLAASAAPLYGAAAALSASAAALAAAGAGGAASGGASASGGFNWGSLFSTALSAWGGGRASGGPVSPNRLYEVGENNKPELLQMHGRSYLIPGNQGNVVPLAGNGGGRSVTVQQSIYVTGAVTPYVAGQMQQEAARKQRIATSRNG